MSAPVGCGFREVTIEAYMAVRPRGTEGTTRIVFVVNTNRFSSSRKACCQRGPSGVRNSALYLPVREGGAIVGGLGGVAKAECGESENRAGATPLVWREEARRGRGRAPAGGRPEGAPSETAAGPVGGTAIGGAVGPPSETGWFAGGATTPSDARTGGGGGGGGTGATTGRTGSGWRS